MVNVETTLLCGNRLLEPTGPARRKQGAMRLQQQQQRAMRLGKSCSMLSARGQAMLFQQIADLVAGDQNAQLLREGSEQK